jgi:hypothetical protein
LLKCLQAIEFVRHLEACDVDASVFPGVQGRREDHVIHDAYAFGLPFGLENGML